MIKRFLVLFLPQLIFRALSKEPKALSDVGLCRTPTNRHQPGSGIRTRVPVSEYACVCVCFGEGANPKFSQGHAAANQSAAGSAEGSVLPYFSEYKQEANNVKLQTAPHPHSLCRPSSPAVSGPRAHHISQEHLCLFWTRSTRKLKHSGGTGRGTVLV